jgi:hypothetical protein
MESTDLDWLISVDDHMLEPPQVWSDRLPQKYKDAGTRMEVRNSIDRWVYEDRVQRSMGLSAVAGKKKEEFSPEPLAYSEIRAGSYEAMGHRET